MSAEAAGSAAHHETIACEPKLERSRGPGIGAANAEDAGIARIQAALDAHVWTGRGALQDRLTMWFILEKAEKAGRIRDLNVSVREVADATGCWPSTASRSLSRLTTTGWIIPGSNNYTGAIRVPSRGWNLVVPTQEPPPHDHLPFDPSGIPAFVGRGLGRAAGYVYEILSDQPISAPHLAMKLNRNKRTILRHLARLKSYGLAKSGVHGWVRGDEHPARVATDLGIDEILQQRRDRHAQESRTFQAGRPPKRITRLDGSRDLVDVETGEIVESDANRTDM